MTIHEKMLSISQIASLCGVGHGTVGYWVRTKKLRAHRVGNQYSISTEALIHYLKSKGREIPNALVKSDRRLPPVSPFLNCWQYFSDTCDRHACDACPIFENRIEVCLTGKETGSLKCPTDCFDCRYYKETYLPKIQFIHQLSSPAAISRGFYLWGGNNPWAKLCGVEEKHLPGMGIEKVIHPDSLENIISVMKKWSLGYLSPPISFQALFKRNGNEKQAVQISVYGLDDPLKTVLLLTNRQKDAPDQTSSQTSGQRHAGGKK